MRYAVLNSVAPREMTGVQIDLTLPIVVTVPRDPLRETAALGAMAAGNASVINTASRASNHPRNQLRGNPNAQYGRDDEPPTYVEALRTSRPVFLPTLARIRRCFTERDIASRFNSNRSLWLDEIADVEGSFVQNCDLTTTTVADATRVTNQNHYRGRNPGSGDTQPTDADHARSAHASEIQSSTSRV